MITGTIKNKVDKIWTDIWAGGIRILTPDGLRLICDGLNRDPEAIGKHFLEVLAKLESGKSR